MLPKASPTHTGLGCFSLFATQLIGFPVPPSWTGRLAWLGAQTLWPTRHCSHRPWEPQHRSRDAGLYCPQVRTGLGEKEAETQAQQHRSLIL